VITRLVSSPLTALLLLCAAAGAWLPQGWKSTVTDRDNRYEGFITEPSANPEWELLSFTATRPDIPAASVLRVAFYLPPSLAALAASTTVVARELEDLQHYRMESKPGAWRAGWNVFGPWPTAAVIDARPGVRRNLGVVVYPEPARATATAVAPAIILVSPGAIDARITGYDAVMRSSRTVSAIVWRLDRIDGTSAVRVSEQRAPGDFIRQEPIHLEVKVPADEGRYRLLICATPRLTLPEQASATPNCAENDVERQYMFHHVPTVKLTAGGDPRRHP